MTPEWKVFAPKKSQGIKKWKVVHNADAVRNLTQSRSINLGDDITCDYDATRIKNICWKWFIVENDLFTWLLLTWIQDYNSRWLFRNISWVEH